MNCFRYFGFTSFEQVDKLTFAQYELLVRAHALREVDKDYRVHQQAFLNFAVKATKKAGKGKERPIYARFEKFFNYKRAITETEERLDGKKKEENSRFSGIGKLLNKQKGE